MFLYQTQNRALAITLATCGVPFAQDPEHGGDVPFIHLYDVAVLRRMKDEKGQPRFKGEPLEVAARKAFQAGIPGLIVYNFQRTELCDRVLKAYDAHSLRLQQIDQGAPLAALTLKIEPEDAAALCCQFTKNRNIFARDWKKLRPYLHLPGASEQRTEGGKTIIIGSFKLTPLKL